jgi:hypothetical protein
MKKIAILIFFTGLTSVVWAGSQYNTYYVFAASASRTSAVYIEKDADCVSMELTIESSQKDPAKRFEEIKQTQNMIIAKAEKSKDIIIRKGITTLSANPISKLSSYAYASSQARLHVMVKLDAQSDIYDAAAKIRNFVDSITMPGKARYSLGRIQLAVENPERYRQEIISKIHDDITMIKTTLQASGELSLSGLNSAVQVRQVTDRKVELYIDYSMTIRTKL